jgi:Mn2+/Fe2+ NRAMP family transporter
MGCVEVDPAKALVWSGYVHGVISVPIMAALIWIGQSKRLTGHTPPVCHCFFGWVATVQWRLP